MQSIEDLIKKHGTNGPAPTASDAGTLEKFDEKMREVRSKEKEHEAQRQASGLKVSYVNLKGFPISPEALSLVPREQAEHLRVVAFLFTGSELRLGALEPQDPAVQELLFQLTERHHANGLAYKISEESLTIALKFYDALPKIKPIVKGVNIADAELERFQSAMASFADIQQAIQRASITDIMTVIMAAGLKFGTSDVHVEAEETKIAVRYRVDGVLQDVASLPHASWKKVIARIKLISGLKININDKPQDGRFTIFLASGDTDVRVSTIPTTWGESVVMRILKPSAINVEFSELGWRPLVEKKLRREIGKPHGMVITTGPTGSGKTTTMYAILRKLNSPDVKIITLEDPIEYKLEGVNQSQIDHTKQYTFANGLRSVLRQDPDVVMVGEIRDLETAEVAINAALTGHLLLSTIHTNAASGALPRFIAMGVKPFLLSPALNAIIGQRLIRKIHADCKTEDAVDPERLEEIKKQLATISPASGEPVPDLERLKFYKGAGCHECNGTGYKGRIGIYELILMDEPIRKALSERISEYEVKQLALAQGMVTMAQDGFLKVLEGLTTVEEVFDATGGE
ncbi:type II/IV secretion system protein [Candidatus Uhrbacteria bacterium]|nr:type II/IV secretion system protein [Candidatus Uhrbacteria bacterium]